MISSVLAKTFAIATSNNAWRLSARSRPGTRRLVCIPPSLISESRWHAGDYLVMATCNASLQAESLAAIFTLDLHLWMIIKNVGWRTTIAS